MTKLAQCDCCGEMKLSVAPVVVFGMDTSACQKCRGDETEGSQPMGTPSSLVARVTLAAALQLTAKEIAKAAAAYQATPNHAGPLSALIRLSDRYQLEWLAFTTQCEQKNSN